ncbi:MAG: maleylacetate reductase, partial [Frankiaceae bacterium]|nr:maleylacetate reductase [Frankiaceae bacterium]
VELTCEEISASGLLLSRRVWGVMAGSSAEGGSAVTFPGADGEGSVYSASVLYDREVRVVFGPGTLTRDAPEARALGTSILLISGCHEAEAADAVCAELGDDLASRIDGVRPHVPVDVASRATAIARQVGAGVVVAIGGGSAVGLAKAVALDTGLPIVAVPTTYAGSEMTPVWGKSDASGKTTGRDARVQPAVVVYDPLLTGSMPIDLSAASGMNALAHAIEALYAPDTTSTSTAVAEEAIATLAHALPRVVGQPGDMEARTRALRGAWLAGWSLGINTMGLHHKLAHVLGGTFQLWHAGVHSALLPQVAAFNVPSARTAFDRAAHALGVGGPEAVPHALFALVRRPPSPAWDWTPALSTQLTGSRRWGR